MIHQGNAIQFSARRCCLRIRLRASESKLAHCMPVTLLRSDDPNRSGPGETAGPESRRRISLSCACALRTAVVRDSAYVHIHDLSINRRPEIKPQGNASPRIAARTRDDGRPLFTRVHLTGGNRPGYRGNRPYRPGPVTVPVGYQQVGSKIFEFEFQKLKI
jgi:hypothetical protein